MVFQVFFPYFSKVFQRYSLGNMRILYVFQKCIELGLGKAIGVAYTSGVMKSNQHNFEKETTMKRINENHEKHGSAPTPEKHPKSVVPAKR